MNPDTKMPGGNGNGNGNGNENGNGNGQGGGRRKTAWMAHVKATMRAHKGMKLKQVLKMAKKTYKKSMRGGSEVIAPFPLSGAGRRRRSGKKTRRGGKGFY